MIPFLREKGKFHDEEISWRESLNKTVPVKLSILEVVLDGMK